MGMGKESPVMDVWEGDKLVGLFIHCPTAACPQPDRFDEEIVRIFNEHRDLAEENKRLKESQGIVDRAIFKSLGIPSPAPVQGSDVACGGR